MKKYKKNYQKRKESRASKDFKGQKESVSLLPTFNIRCGKKKKKRKEILTFRRTERESLICIRYHLLQAAQRGSCLSWRSLEWEKMCARWREKYPFIIGYCWWNRWMRNYEKGQLGDFIWQPRQYCGFSIFFCFSIFRVTFDFSIQVFFFS